VVTSFPSHASSNSGFQRVASSTNSLTTYSCPSHAIFFMGEFVHPRLRTSGGNECHSILRETHDNILWDCWVTYMAIFQFRRLTDRRASADTVRTTTNVLVWESETHRIGPAGSSSPLAVKEAGRNILMTCMKVDKTHRCASYPLNLLEGAKASSPGLCHHYLRQKRVSSRVLSRDDRRLWGLERRMKAPGCSTGEESRSAPDPFGTEQRKRYHNTPWPASAEITNRIALSWEDVGGPGHNDTKKAKDERSRLNQLNGEPLP